MSVGRPLVLLMGVAGVGKTTVGRLLAERLGCPFIDADDLHPAENVDRMRAGRPLEDRHRWPWLDAVGRRLRRLEAAGDGGVVACSALTEAHRGRLGLGRVPGLQTILLTAPPAELAARLSRRRGHFFPPSLLDSQLATLEEPRGVLRLDTRARPEAVVERIAAGLAAEEAR